MPVFWGWQGGALVALLPARRVALASGESNMWLELPAVERLIPGHVYNANNMTDGNRYLGNSGSWRPGHNRRTLPSPRRYPAPRWCARSASAGRPSPYPWEATSERDREDCRKILAQNKGGRTRLVLGVGGEQGSAETVVENSPWKKNSVRIQVCLGDYQRRHPTRPQRLPPLRQSPCVNPAHLFLEQPATT